MNWKVGLYSFVGILLVGTAILYFTHKSEPMIHGRMVDKFDTTKVVQVYFGQFTKLREIYAKVEVDNLDSANIATIGRKLFRNFVSEDQEKDTVKAQFFFYKKSDVHDLDPELVARFNLSGPKGVKVASKLKHLDNCVVYQEFSQCLVPPQLPKFVIVIQPFDIPMNCTFREFIKLISK
ncbi:MAG: hypothetical protein U0Y96_08060 [Candidatus Kapaibacterium sp.]